MNFISLVIKKCENSTKVSNHFFLNKVSYNHAQDFFVKLLFWTNLSQRSQNHLTEKLQTQQLS